MFLTSLPLPRPDLLAPKDLDLNMGTAEILRLPEVRELITSDFLVLPCDLVCELGGELLLQAWQVKSASLVDTLGPNTFSNGHQPRYSGGLGVWYDTKANTPIKKEETDFIATAPLPSSPEAPPKESLFSSVSKLVYSMPTDSLKDITEERGGVPLRHGLLKQNPETRMLTTHRDAHIYIFPRWILDFVSQNDRMESISEDVVGWWAKAGWQPGLAEKLHIKEICAPSQSDEGSQASPTSDTYPGIPSPDKLPPGMRKPSLTLALGLEHGKPHEAEVPSILAYVHSGAKQTTGSLIRRVDTAQLLLAISLQLAKLPSLEESGPESVSPYAHSKKIAYPEGVKSRTTITKQDCLIGDNVTVEEKVAIKESVVGTGCQISEGAKLSQCLLMEGVKVGKNCKLTKCILGKRCVIGDGSVLTDCEVQENLLVENRSKHFADLAAPMTHIANNEFNSRGKGHQIDEFRRTRGYRGRNGGSPTGARRPRSSKQRGHGHVTGSPSINLTRMPKFTFPVIVWRDFVNFFRPQIQIGWQDVPTPPTFPLPCICCGGLRTNIAPLL